MTSLRAFDIAFVTALALTFLLPSAARAAPGCSDGMGGGCFPILAGAPGVTDCDSSCTTGLCVGDATGLFCVEPTSCAAPCTTAGPCPTIKIGNTVIGSEGGTAAACGYGTGCGFITISPREGVVGPDPCLHAGDTGITALLRGDCDGDQVPNVAEAPALLPVAGGTARTAFCSPQEYASPAVPSARGTCNMARCTSGCIPGFPPHGGVVCAADMSQAYACMTRDHCPSTPGLRPTACLSRNDFAGGVIGACLYVPTCSSEPGQCFDFERADGAAMWLESAYSVGDCDGDGVANADDPADCGPQLVSWPGDTGPVLERGSRACAPGSLCGVAGDCSRLELCAGPSAIGLSCDPDSPSAGDYCTDAMGVDAECVYAGTSSESAEALCVPSDPADESCGPLRGRSCFATGAGIDPADSYHLGDCDGDGLINGEDPDVCDPNVPGPDSGTSADLDSGIVSSPDVGPVDGGGLPNPDAASDSPDAGGSGEIDAGEDGRFAGSGCSCRVERARAPSAAGFLALLVLGLLVRARRARSRR